MVGSAHQTDGAEASRAQLTGRLNETLTVKLGFPNQLVTDGVGKTPLLVGQANQQVRAAVIGIRFHVLGGLRPSFIEKPAFSCQAASAAKRARSEGLQGRRQGGDFSAKRGSKEPATKLHKRTGKYDLDGSERRAGIISLSCGQESWRINLRFG
jgi:hypothetical protein